MWGTGNPNGVNGFDNILWAFIPIFQCISLEGWVAGHSIPCHDAQAVCSVL